MDFLPEHISSYSENHTTEESDVLKKLNRATHIEVLQPRMLSGHLQGRLLKMIVQMIRPSKILEIGTYTGYSAICMAEGLAKNGIIHTIDINEELEAITNRFIMEAGFENQIKQYVGDAVEIIPTINEQFDLVFMDADKENYLTYYDLLIDKLNSGSYILADNVLWSGKVTEEAKPNDKETKHLQAFNQRIQEDDRVENILLPVRDGLFLIRVK
jgi:caffeoyl-CoA O-methyltransferase